MLANIKSINHLRLTSQKIYVKKFPNIKRIPSNTPHNQLISEGVDVVLTVFGSVQFEYPFFNIPVIYI